MFLLLFCICYYVLFVIILIKDNIYKIYGMKKLMLLKDVWCYVWKEEEDRKVWEMVILWFVVWGDLNWIFEVVGLFLEF